MARRCGASSAPWSSAARARRPSSARQLCSLTHVLNYSPTRVPTHLLTYSPTHLLTLLTLLTYSPTQPAHLRTYALTYLLTSTVYHRVRQGEQRGAGRFGLFFAERYPLDHCEQLRGLEPGPRIEDFVPH